MKKTFAISIFALLLGSCATIPKQCRVTGSGSITDLVLRFPSSPSNGDVVVAKFDFAVTTLTADGQGKTIFGFPTSTILGQHREWRYDATTGAWY